MISISPLLHGVARAYFLIIQFARSKAGICFCVLLPYRKIKNTKRLNICDWHAALCGHALSREKQILIQLEAPLFGCERATRAGGISKGKRTACR